MSVRFFLANPQAVRSSLVVIIYHEGRRYKKGIGVSIDTRFWDTHTQQSPVNLDYPEGEAVNEEITKWRNNLNAVFDIIRKNNISIKSATQFWHMLDCQIRGISINTSVLKVSLTEYMEYVFIPRFDSIKSNTRIARFKAVLNKLKDYEQHATKSVSLRDVNIIFYRDLHNYMNSLGHSTNYFGAVIKIIKQVMLEAKNIDKLHDNTEFQHSNFKAITQDVDKVYLTVEELQKIAHVVIDDRFIEFVGLAKKKNRDRIKKAYNVVKNRFLIGSFTGLRLSDFSRIDAGNISKGKIVVITEKTDQRIVIPIHPIVQNIINSGFDMNDLVSDVKTRSYIKEICKYAGINDIVEVRESVGGRVVIRRCQKWELVGTHTARRSFATNAYKAGIPTLAIMKITGHTKESTFMKYIRISEDENADILSKHNFFN